MYFPGDPLFAYDPIFQSVRNERARERMIGAFSMDRSQENWALAYEFDIILGGRAQTPIEEAH
jgi:protocatechuate 3,4-dioxygenase, beta subunit